MYFFSYTRQLGGVFFALCLAAAAPQAWAGPWNRLPDAVGRLQVEPGNKAAEAVLGEAEASILSEAVSGRLAAVRALMEVYASLVMRLPNGDTRLERLERRTAAALVAFGDARRATDLRTAATAWGLAAEFDSSSVAIERLREILLPPADPEEGAEWTAPIDGAELVYLPPMRVRVGCSEGDRRCRENEIFFRWVEVPGFWIETKETTNDRYRRCVNAGACTEPTPRWRYADPGRGEEPVTGVSWRQAREYALWAGRKLPTESGWERAARGKETRWRFPWNSNARRADLANVRQEIPPFVGGVVLVGTFPATGWGLYDIAGNVWEWCADPYQLGFKELPVDGSSMRSGSGRVVRGGSWRRTIDLARVSARSWFEEDYSADDLGFRCVMRPSSTVSPATVLATAARAFPVRVRPGGEFAGAALTTEDRSYLDRRAITWLDLEGRTAEAVPLAVALLRRDSRDRVALSLLDRAEEELAEQIRAGNLDGVERLFAAYSEGVTGEKGLERRFRSTSDRLLVPLRASCEAAIRGGDRRRAVACLELGLRISPDDRELQRLLASLARRPGELQTWAPDGKAMIWVPGGAFRLGASEGDRQAALDELPATQVQVAGFLIDRTEVTNAEYRRCVEAGACTPPGHTEVFRDPRLASFPVLWVSWDQAWSYARWAGKRLPSEAEWERAARAGTTERFPWGARWDPAMANGLEPEGHDRWSAAAPVASFPANAWGIHDLVGNASEWVQDVYHSSYSDVPRDGRAWERETGSLSERKRVARGGSFLDPPPRNRVSRRAGRRPTKPHRAIGFRCAANEFSFGGDLTR